MGAAMPYEYSTDIAISDVAFHAWGDGMDELFVAAADATLNVMVEDLRSIEDRVRYPIELKEPSDEMLLFNFLQELIFLEDAEQLALARAPCGDSKRQRYLSSHRWGNRRKA